MNHLKRNFQTFKTVKLFRFVQYAAGTFLRRFPCSKRCSKVRQIDKFEKYLRKSDSLLNKELNFKKFLMR